MKVTEPREARLLTAAEKCVYKEGVKHGVSLYAWWKDGVEYVGTCNTTKIRALELIEKGEAPEALWINAIGDE